MSFRGEPGWGRPANGAPAVMGRTPVVTRRTPAVMGRPAAVMERTGEDCSRTLKTQPVVPTGPALTIFSQ